MNKYIICSIFLLIISLFIIYVNGPHVPGMLDDKHVLSPFRDGSHTKRGGIKEDDQLLPVGGFNPCLPGSAFLHSQTYMEVVQQEIWYVQQTFFQY